MDGVSIEEILASPEQEAAFLEEIYQSLKEKIYRYDRDLYGQKKRYLNLFPSDGACARRREKVRQQVNRHRSHVPIPELIDKLNQQLDGWAGYFSKGYPRKSHRQMNRFVQLRLIKHLKRRSQRPYRPPAEVTWYQHLYGNLGLIQL